MPGGFLVNGLLLISIISYSSVGVTIMEYNYAHRAIVTSYRILRKYIFLSENYFYGFIN